MTPDTSEPRDDRRATLINGIQDITNALLENNALNDILVMVLETIYRGLGFTRVLFCIVDRNRKLGNARFGLGKDIDTILRRFHFPITNASDLFSLAVSQRKDVICRDTGTGTSDIPVWYRRLVSANTFVLFPIIVNEVALGLIYCDIEGLDARINDSDLNYLNTLRNQATLAIKQRS